jgi:hypothetical protein
VADNAFVIMQVGAKDSPERKRADEVYNFIIGPALREHGIEPIRADLDPTPGPITAKMLSDLVNSSLVIVDLTGRNPNVFYELGIAHSFARPMIAIADSVKNLPFDAKDERVIEIGAYVDGGLTYAQGESAKQSLDASLRVVLTEGYVAPTPLREVAGTQSLHALAPENPLASEIGQIKETLDEVREMARRNAGPRPSGIPPTLTENINAMRAFIRESVLSGEIPMSRLAELTPPGTSRGHSKWAYELFAEARAPHVFTTPTATAAAPIPRDQPLSTDTTPSWADAVAAQRPSYEEPPF